jgi:mannose-1-phosphate guanylyltransferase
MLNSVLRRPRNFALVHSTIRNMTGGVSYAAAVSTPNGSLRQPQIQSRACSDPDLRASFESQPSKQPQTKPQRPGAGIRSRTSFRGWASKKGREAENQERGPIQEVQHGFVPRIEHQPNTGATEEHVYVLTMKLEDTLSKPMNALRQQYFPKRLNRTPAHLTLFHALPHSHLEAIEQGLYQLATGTKPFNVTTGGPFRMRKGVGVNVDAGYQDMKEVHGQLRSQWMPFLSEQDQGGFRPHWTVMNKVDEEKEVEHALSAVRKELSHSTKEGRAVGLELWRYDRGNWIWANEYSFGAPKQASSQNAGSTNNAGGSHPSKNESSSLHPPGNGPGKRPGMSKRGSSVADAWRSMSFRRKS